MRKQTLTILGESWKVIDGDHSKMLGFKVSGLVQAAESTRGMVSGTNRKKVPGRTKGPNHRQNWSDC